MVKKERKKERKKDVKRRHDFQLEHLLQKLFHNEQ